MHTVMLLPPQSRYRTVLPHTHANSLMESPDSQTSPCSPNPSTLWRPPMCKLPLWPSPECHINGIICNLSRLVFFSCNIMPLRFVQVAVCISTSFFIASSIPVCGQTLVCLSNPKLRHI